MSITEGQQRQHGSSVVGTLQGETLQGENVEIPGDGEKQGEGVALNVYVIEDEPSMYLQRPSSASRQDVAHVLAHTFRERFTRSTVTVEMVHQLMTSQHGGDDAYHERYVEALLRVRLIC